MKSITSNTKLMNLMIALSQKNSNFPSALYDIGYQLESIEPHFVDSDGNLINPDIQLKSHNDKNLAFVECKSGGVDHEQAINFMKVKKQDIIDKNVTSLDMADFNFEFVYFCHDTNKDKLIEADDKNKYGFPILCCYDDKITLEKNELKGAKLKSIFPINISKHIPTEYYPYGPDDKIEYIAMSIFQSLLRLMNNEEVTIDMIIKDSHKLYELIDTKGKNKIKAIVGKILNDLEQDEFKDVVKRLKNPTRYRINPKSYKKFRDLCLGLIDRYKTNAPQLSLIDFG